MKKTLLTLIFALLWAAPTFATHTCTTCYISFSTGNDSWDGTSKVFVSGTIGPWKHVKGMLGATGNAASQAPVAGDSYILMGGDIWPNASLGWLINYSGTGSTTPVGCTGTGCIYIGVDQTYFTGASWSRPILDGGSTAVGNNSGFAGTFVRIFANNIKFDNIEFTGLFWTGTSSLGTQAYMVLATGTPGKGVNVEYSNLYMHNWSHAAYPIAKQNDCGVVGDTNPYANNNVGSSIHDSIFDGSGETTGTGGCTAIFGGPPYIYNNQFTNVGSCSITNGTLAIYGNTCENVGPTFDLTPAHTNGFEVNAGPDVMVYNNVIRHLGNGTLGLFVGVYSGYNSYIFNNVIYDTDTGNSVDPGWATIGNAIPIANIVGNGATAVVTCTANCFAGVNGTYTITGNSQAGFNTTVTATAITPTTFSFASATNATGTGGTFLCAHSGNACTVSGGFQFYNNTEECGQNSNPTAACLNFGTQLLASTVQNNHFITSAGGNIANCTSGGWCQNTATTPTVTTNILQTKTTANGQGYSSGQTNPFSPTLGGSTILAGTDSTSFCTAVTAIDTIAGAACASSTTAGVIYNTTSHTVTVPFLATLPRGVTPDAGAYQFPTAQVATPTFSPGAGTYSGTQNVTLLDSTGGAVICFRLDGITPTSSSPGVCGAGSTTYTIPVVVSSSLTILAIGTEATFTDSAVGTAVYVINPLLPAPVVMF